MSTKVNQHWQQVLKQVIGTLTFALGMTVATVNAYAMTLPTDGLRTYQNSPSLSEEHKQILADDLNRLSQADNIWDVLRDEFSLPHYEDNPLVQEKIEFFMNNQDFLLRSVNRAAPYMYYIMQQVKKRHLPAELVLMPIVESGYNPFAISPVGASGIWQLMPLTATGLGVQQNWFYDGRRDVIASTRAALNYLAYLQSFFDGNWLLAIAAYNTGEGNVLAAIRRNIADGRDTDFWSLPVATQTKNYVPSILALAIIISNPDKYPIYFPPVRNAPYLAEFDVQKKLNLRQAATLAGISYGKMISLNPGFNRPASKSGYKLILPIENVEQFSENLMHSPYRDDTPPAWKHYRMKPGDTLLTVARKFKTTTDAIRKLNHLAKSAPRRGTNLLIPNISSAPTVASNDDTETQAAPAQPTRSKKKSRDSMAMRLNDKLLAAAGKSGSYQLQPGDTVYMVRNGDTLDTIAHRFHISTSLLRSANKNINGNLIPGKEVFIPTHPGETSMITNNQTQTHEVTYVVRRGDTIATIAKRFNTSPASIRLANMIDDSSLLEGVSLTIPTPIAS